MYASVSLTNASPFEYIFHYIFIYITWHFINFIANLFFALLDCFWLLILSYSHKKLPEQINLATVEPQLHLKIVVVENCLAVIPSHAVWPCHLIKLKACSCDVEKFAIIAPYCQLLLHRFHFQMKLFLLTKSLTRLLLLVDAKVTDD